jgi:hypothetical protein
MMNSSLFLSGMVKYRGLSINTATISLLILRASRGEFFMVLLPTSDFAFYLNVQIPIGYFYRFTDMQRVD